MAGDHGVCCIQSFKIIVNQFRVYKGCYCVQNTQLLAVVVPFNVVQPILQRIVTLGTAGYDLYLSLVHIARMVTVLWITDHHDSIRLAGLQGGLDHIVYHRLAVDKIILFGQDGAKALANTAAENEYHLHDGHSFCASGIKAFSLRAYLPPLGTCA